MPVSCTDTDTVSPPSVTSASTQMSPCSGACAQRVQVCVHACPVARVYAVIPCPDICCRPAPARPNRWKSAASATPHSWLARRAAHVPAAPASHPLGELARVAQQVVQHLHQPAGVAHNLQRDRRRQSWAANFPQHGDNGQRQCYSAQSASQESTERQLPASARACSSGPGLTPVYTAVCTGGKLGLGPPARSTHQRRVSPNLVPDRHPLLDQRLGQVNHVVCHVLQVHLTLRHRQFALQGEQE